MYENKSNNFVLKLKRTLRNNRITRLPYRVMSVLVSENPRSSFRRTKRKIRRLLRLKKTRFSLDVSAEERQIQATTKFSKDTKFSIVVPLYNTPIDFLTQMVESVLNQTYSNWELCLADGSDDEHAYVGELCQKYASKESRIIYKKLENNLGISENTNAALKMTSGNYIALFDHDDLLHSTVLYHYAIEIEKTSAELLYCDEATFIETLDNITVIHYKPDFAIDNLRGNNYICHFSVFKKSLLDKTGGFRKEFDGSQDHDLMLRLSEHVSSHDKIVHLPKVLYFWRSHPNSVAMDLDSKPFAVLAGQNAVRSHLDRVGLKASVSSAKRMSTVYKIDYEITSNPLVSIVIPSKDQVHILKMCINSILKKSTYKNYEIIIIENGSKDAKTFKYYDSLSQYDNIKIVTWEHEFNYSKINNFGVKFAKGEQLILLNNDIEVISEDWIEQMLMYNQRDDVAITGAKLYYPNNRIQHGGVVLGFQGVAGHSHYLCDRSYQGYMGRLFYSQNMSAVTAACMMVKKRVFDAIDGFDCDFAIAYNDVDLCMRARKLGYLICWTPYSELFHHESLSRGFENTPEKRKRFKNEMNLFKSKWQKELDAGDPYYNPNFDLVKETFDY